MNDRRASRWRAALRPLTGLGAIGAALTLRAFCLALWVPAWLAALLSGRPAAWWASLAARSLSRGERSRRYAWMLDDVPPRRSQRIGALEEEPGAPGRRGILARPLTAPPYALLRYAVGALGWANGLLLALTATFAGRRPAPLAASGAGLSAFAQRCDRYVLGLAPRRPRLPEPDPRLGGREVTGPPDHGALPPWPRRLVYPAVAIDFGFSVAILAAAAGVAELVAGAGAAEDFPGWLELVATLAVQVLPVAAVAWIAARNAPLSAELIGLHVLRPLRSLLEAAGVGAAMLVVAVAILLLAAIPAAATEAQRSSLVAEDAGVWIAVAAVAVAVVVAPLLEEVLYRGFLFQFLRAGRGTWAAAAISSFIFALAHLEPDPLALLNRTALGIGLCWVFARTGRLLPAILLHAGNNAIVVAIELA